MVVSPRRHDRERTRERRERERELGNAGRECGRALL